MTISCATWSKEYFSLYEKMIGQLMKDNNLTSIPIDSNSAFGKARWIDIHVKDDEKLYRTTKIGSEEYEIKLIPDMHRLDYGNLLNLIVLWINNNITKEIKD